METIKQGGLFQRTLPIPIEYPDGFFASYTPLGQVRVKRDHRILLANLSFVWLDPVTTRFLTISVNSALTQLWPLADIVVDLRFVSPQGNIVDVQNFAEYRVIRPVTEIL